MSTVHDDSVVGALLKVGQSIQNISQCFTGFSILHARRFIYTSVTHLYCDVLCVAACCYKFPREEILVEYGTAARPLL